MPAAQFAADAGLLFGVLALLVRYWRGSEVWQLGLVASAPYLMLAVPVGLVAALVCRRWLVAGALVVVGALCVATQLPLHTVSPAPDPGLSVRVMTQNAELGGADATSIVDAVRTHRVGVLTITELSPELEQRLMDAGIERLLPYSATSARNGADGTGLWSQTPLHDVRMLAGFRCDFVAARTSLQPDQPDVELAGIHLIGPTYDAGGWRRDVNLLPSALNQLGQRGPVILSGDFNATPDSPWLRDVYAMGYVDAADQSGAGLVQTYPADRALPAMLAIDHVLSKGGPVATSVERVRIPGTDHFGVVAHLRLPRG